MPNHATARHGDHTGRFAVSDGDDWLTFTGAMIPGAAPGKSREPLLRLMPAWTLVTEVAAAQAQQATNELPGRPVLVFWLLAVALEVVLGVAFIVSGAEDAIEEGLTARRHRVRVGSDDGNSRCHRLPSRDPGGRAGAGPGRRTRPGRLAVVQASRGGLDCRRRVESSPSLVRRGRLATRATSVADRSSGFSLCNLASGLLHAISAARPPDVDVLLVDAGVAPSGDVPRRRCRSGRERLARLCAARPAPDAWSSSSRRSSWVWRGPPGTTQ